MADSDSTDVSLVFRPIRPTIVRGSLVHQVVDVQFVQFKQALCAASAVQALQEERTATLATVRTAGSDMEAFREASRHEAQLAAQIRRRRRQGSAQ